MRTSPAIARAVIVPMLLAAVAALDAQRGGGGGLGGPGGLGGVPGRGARLPPDEPQRPSQDDTPTFRSGVTLVPYGMRLERQAAAGLSQMRRPSA